MRPEDVTTMGLAAQRDVESADAAVDALFRAHYYGLLRLAVLLVDGEDSAEDLVQDAFAALYRRWPRIRDKEAAYSYLRTSVVNGSRSRLRRLRTARRFVPGEADGAGADAGVLLAEEHALVHAALRRLPRRQQEVLVLRYYADLDEAAIAATLGISRGAVKSHASRAIAALTLSLQAES